VGVAADQGARAVIFGDQLVAVVEEPGDARAAGGLDRPAERVVGERTTLS
jgi:hypothetical protein